MTGYFSIMQILPIKLKYFFLLNVIILRKNTYLLSIANSL